jgi:hypothetical protein
MDMYKLCFYVPVLQLESVKEAVFAAGAGKIGNYEACAWQVLGKGQFRAQGEANPFIGQVGQLEQVEEYRVEMVVEAHCIVDVIHALKAAHPYETPAYDVTLLCDF